MSSGTPKPMALPFRYEGRRNSITLLLIAVLATPLLSAQFSSGVNLVEVYAAVTDKAGNPVTGLKSEDFTVLEDGQRQTLSAFAEGDFPLSVAIGLDRSFSMGQQLPTAVSAARTFLGELRPQDQSMIVSIGSEIDVLAPLSDDRPAQLRALSTLKPWGTTGLHDAIIESIEAVQAAKGRRALVLLSDGSDRYSRAAANEALERARRSDVMIYPVALGRSRPELFAQLAALTGGRSFHPKNTAELNVILRTIANELRHQYLLGYTPSRAIVRGEERWRPITVRVNRADATVRARDGYLAR